LAGPIGAVSRPRIHRRGSPRRMGCFLTERLLQRQLPIIHRLTDDELLRRLGELVTASRRVEAVLIAHIAEVDQRRLFLREATPSMFAYCTDVLHLSEQEAYLRISVARAARDHPLLLVMLADGRLHLTGAGRIVPHLGREDATALLTRAAFKSRRAIEEMLVALAPQPDAPTVVRKMPTHRAIVVPADSVTTAAAGTPDAGTPYSSISLSPAPSPAPRPLAPDRYKIQFTAGAAFCRKLDRAKDLTRSAIPGGDVGAILEAALTEMLGRLEARRFGVTSKPKDNPPAGADAGRYLPAAIRRTVFPARRGALSFRERGRSALFGTNTTGVPPRGTLRAGRSGHPRQHPAHVPAAQRAPGGARLRRPAHGALPERPGA
jgi:hypothetical protein